MNLPLLFLHKQENLTNISLWSANIAHHAGHRCYTDQVRLYPDDIFAIMAHQYRNTQFESKIRVSMSICSPKNVMVYPEHSEKFTLKLSCLVWDRLSTLDHIGFMDDAIFKDDTVTCVQLLWPRLYVNREVVTITLYFRRQ
jgi:hypothetical protein